MNITFNLYRYSPQYEYGIIESRNGEFYALYQIKDVILKKETYTKKSYFWLIENHLEFFIRVIKENKSEYKDEYEWLLKCHEELLI